MRRSYAVRMRYLSIYLSYPRTAHMDGPTQPSCVVARCENLLVGIFFIVTCVYRAP